jgi:hypothetical protein
VCTHPGKRCTSPSPSYQPLHQEESRTARSGDSLTGIRYAHGTMYSIDDDDGEWGWSRQKQSRCQMHEILLLEVVCHRLRKLIPSSFRCLPAVLVVRCRDCTDGGDVIIGNITMHLFPFTEVHDSLFLPNDRPDSQAPA